VTTAATTQEWLLTLAAGISAVGTIGAVFAALFVIPRREKRRRPKLSVTFDPESRFDALTTAPRGRGLSHWVLPRVHNQAGRDMAVDVEVVFLEMLNLETGEPLNFENRCLEWGGVGGAQISVAAGAYRHITLLYLASGDQVPEPGTADFKATVVAIPDPGGGRNALPAGRYRARFVVTAKNADAAHYEIDVDYDGTWWPDSEIWKHLVIGQPRRVAV
jgi:hypothetical protein